MKIKVEIDVFDDPEFCMGNDKGYEEFSEECNKLDLGYPMCGQFKEALKGKFIKNLDDGDCHCRPIKCDQCKKAYKKAGVTLNDILDDCGYQIARLLAENNICSIENLLSLEEGQIRHIKGLGRMSAAKLIRVLSQRGLALKSTYTPDLYLDKSKKFT